MSREHLPLNALRAFEVAASYQSMSRAAEELHVTQAAVSQQIAQLEERLQTPLFTRHHRRVQLTEEGRALATVLQHAFEEISTAVRRLRRKRDSRVLKIVLFPTLAARWLLPRLARFHERFPDVDVQITTSMQAVDFAQDDVDFSVLYAEQIPKDVEGVPIMKEVLLPVCSPAYAKVKAVNRVEALETCTWIHSTNRLSDWPKWLAHVGLDIKPAGGALLLNNSYLAYQAAIDGAGVAMAQLELVRQDLAEGRLVAPIAHELHTGRVYFLTYLTNRRAINKVAAFKDWIAEEHAVAGVPAQGDPS